MNETNSAQQQVRRAVRRGLWDIPAERLVLIACSGGPDSLALARAASGLDRRVGAVIVDHQLQAGSAMVADRAAAACRDWGLDPVEVCPVTVAVGPGHGGPEAAARHARRAALLDAAQRTDAVAVALAHTRDDQAETVLLRLARGSGARSLGAMAEFEGLWRRPLLHLPRSVVHASVSDVYVWADPHNQDTRFARTRVRVHALPELTRALGNGVVAGLARSAELLRDDADALDAYAKTAWPQCVLTEEDLDLTGETVCAAITLDIEALTAQPRAIRTRLLRRALIAVSSPGPATTFDQVRAVEALISDWHGQGPLDLPGGVKAQRACGRLRVSSADDPREQTRED